MLKQLNIKREYSLVAVTIIMLLATWQLAFKKTIAAWQIHNDLKKQIVQTTDGGYQPGYLDRKSINLDKIISLYKADTINYRSNSLSSISSIAEKENVKLAEVPSQDVAYHSNQFVIQKLSFDGDYFPLLKTLNKLQNLQQIGVIRSAIIRKQARYGSDEDSKKVIMEVYLEVVR